MRESRRIAGNVTRYEEAAQVAFAPGTERTVEEYRTRTLRDIGVPLAFAGISGAIAAGVTALPASWWAWWPWQVPVTVGAITLGVVWLFTGTGAISDDHQLVTRTETWLGRDLDGDGVVGQPAREYVPVRLDVEHGGRHRFLDLDITRELALFASRVIAGSVSFGERGALDCGAAVGEFEALRDELMERGVVRWKNPDNHRSGYDFLGGYHATLRAIVDHSPGG